MGQYLANVVLVFARTKILIDYPTGNLGEFVVDQEKISAAKGDVTDGPAYTINVKDQTKEQIGLTIESPCDNNEPHYVLDTVYEKLATLTVEVNEWGDFGTMNVNDFSVEGTAEFVNPATFQGTPGCTEFNDLCGEGEYIMDFCSNTSTNLSGNAGVQDVVIINGSKFGAAQQASKLLIPNAETGGLTMDHSFDATDSRFLTWSTNQISVKVSNVTFGNLIDPLPMSSGIWKMRPATGTTGDLGCQIDVDVPFSTRSKFDGANIEKRYIFASGFPEALTTPNFTGDDELEVYLDANIDGNTIASAQGISTTTLTPIVEQILLQIEQFSGYDICFGGVRGASNPPPQGGNIVIDFGPIPSNVNGNPVAFTNVGLEGIERCPNSSQVFSHWNSSRIVFNQGYSFHIGPVPTNGIPSGQFDLESVLYHEFGHAFMLDHSNDMSVSNGTSDTRTMYFELDPTQVKRTFDQETISGFSNTVNFSFNFLNANSGGTICVTELLNPLWMDINIDNSTNCFTSKTNEFVTNQECLGIELYRGDASILVSAKQPVKIDIFHIDGRLIRKATQKRHHTIPITFRSPIVIKAYNSECIFSQIYIP